MSKQINISEISEVAIMQTNIRPVATKDVKKLAQAIDKQGLLSPIVISELTPEEIEDDYQLRVMVAGADRGIKKAKYGINYGHHRFAAVKALGRKTIECERVIKLADRPSPATERSQAYAENIKRKEMREIWRIGKGIVDTIRDLVAEGKTGQDIQQQTVGLDYFAVKESTTKKYMKEYREHLYYNDTNGIRTASGTVKDWDGTQDEYKQYMDRYIQTEARDIGKPAKAVYDSEKLAQALKDYSNTAEDSIENLEKKEQIIAQIIAQYQLDKRRVKDAKEQMEKKQKELDTQDVEDDWSQFDDTNHEIEQWTVITPTAPKKKTKKATTKKTTKKTKTEKAEK